MLVVVAVEIAVGPSHCQLAVGFAVACFVAHQLGAVVTRCCYFVGQLVGCSIAVFAVVAVVVAAAVVGVVDFPIVVALVD